MKTNFVPREKSIIPYLVGFAIFIYLVLRVFLMPVSDDEYTTVNVHATMSWWDILTTGQPNIVWAPNNHVLNTLFVKAEMSLFGRHDWAIRLHVLLAFVVAFHYATKIIRLITTSVLRQVLYLLILFFNPYLLDFFGIARGYAWSIAGFLVAFYYFMSYTESLSLKDLRNMFIGLLIAVWSNFSAIYLLALVTVLVVYEIFLHKKKIEVKRHLLFVIAACSIITIIIIIPLIRTINSGESFGGKSGLFQDGIVTYINQFMHHNGQLNRHAVFTEGWKYIEVAGIVLLLFWILLHIISFLFKANIRITKMQLYTLFMVAGVACIAKALYFFFEVPYPTARTQLLYSMPFYIGICVAFERMITFNKYVVAIPIMISLGLCWHFAESVRFDNTIEWWQTGDAKRVVKFLKEDLQENNPGRVLKLGIESWQFPSLAFYTETEFKDQLSTHWTDLNTEEKYDLLFVSNHMEEKAGDAYETLRRFKHGVLLKLKGVSTSAQRPADQK